MRIMLFALLFVFTSTAWSTGFNYSSYQTAQLSDAASSFELDPESDYMVDAAMRKYHVEATFTGNVRPIGSGLGKFISGWARALNIPPHIPGMFNTAVEIRQGSTTLWMPIQDGLLDPFVKEVPPNSKVHVFILLLGAHNQAPVFVINEFHADAQ